jgi:hypothetical protein
MTSNDVTVFLSFADEDAVFLKYCLPCSLHGILFLPFTLQEASSPIFRNIWYMPIIKQLTTWSRAVFEKAIVALIITKISRP